MIQPECITQECHYSSLVVKVAKNLSSGLLCASPLCSTYIETILLDVEETELYISQVVELLILLLSR